MKRIFLVLTILALGGSLSLSNAENWNIAGVWSGEANGYSFRMTLRQSGSTFTGLYYDQSGQGDATSSLTGSIDFERNTIRFIRTLPDGYTQTYTGFIFWGWTKGRGMAGTFGTGSSTSEAGWYAKR
jgi:hypothetical protein